MSQSLSQTSGLGTRTIARPVDRREGQQADGLPQGPSTPIVSGAWAKTKLSMPRALAYPVLVATPPRAVVETRSRNVNSTVPWAGRLANRLHHVPL